MERSTTFTFSSLPLPLRGAALVSLFRNSSQDFREEVGNLTGKEVVFRKKIFWKRGGRWYHGWIGSRICLEVLEMASIAVDFDGVIHSYRSGWEGPRVIADGPVLGAGRFLEDCLRIFDRVYIYFSRARYPLGKWVIRRWLKREFPTKWRRRIVPVSMAFLGAGALGEVVVVFPGFESIVVTAKKPPAVIYLDDRAVCFEGHFPHTGVIRLWKEFKPWNRRGVEVKEEQAGEE